MQAHNRSAAGKSLRPVTQALRLLLCAVALLAAGILGRTDSATAQDAVAGQPGSGIETAGFPRLVEVTGDRVRIRTGPSLNHFPFSAVNLSARLVAERIEGDWVQVHLPPYMPVWISAEFLQDRGDGTLLVTGSRVRVRGTPGTEHAPIGMVPRDLVVHGTGKKDPQGTWVQVMAPSGSMVYLHRDFVRLAESVAPSQVAMVVRGLQAPRVVAAVPRPGEPSADGAATGSGAAGRPGAIDDDAMLVGLGRLSPRLQAVYKLYQSERKKESPRDWNFGPILSQLDRIGLNSEDLGEVENAERWQKVIREHLLPIQKQILDMDRDEELARRAEAERDRDTGDQIKRAVHKKYPSGEGEEGYLATGWVVLLGKHRQVDATHKLMKGNQLLFYLRSDQVNLDDFVNHRVGLQGTLRELPPEQGAKLVLVTSIQGLSR